MPQTKPFLTLLPLILGAVIINTMPVWLAELADHRDISGALAGGFASLLLLSAALGCAAPIRGGAGLPVRVIVPLAFALLALGEALSAAILGIACAVLGLALGILTKRALQDLQQDAEPLTRISTALALGLGVAFVLYLVLYAFPLRVLWILAAMSLVLLLARPVDLGQASGTGLQGSKARLRIGVFPFFVMMGAYWSFLEIYGQSIGAGDGLTIWLLASLITGVIGSALAGILPQRHWHRAQRLAVLAAALSGAISYVAPGLNLLGPSIAANGFFLFVFFPLYVAAHRGQAPMAMASYLLGFAFGGLAGALVTQATGYPGLALAILISGLIAAWSGTGTDRSIPRS